MKAIIVYYSLEGNTEYTAGIIADYTGAEVLRLDPVKEYPKGNFSKFLWGGKSVVFGERPRLNAYHFNSNDFDTIIIGSPVWAGSFAPPIKSFLKENDLTNKKVAFFVSSAGGDVEKCFHKLKQEVPQSNVVATLNLIDPKKKISENNKILIKEFCDKLN